MVRCAAVSRGQAVQVAADPQKWASPDRRPVLAATNLTSRLLEFGARAPSLTPTASLDSGPPQLPILLQTLALLI